VPHRSETVQLTAHANAYAERLIGSIRRECLDHVIVWNARGLQRILNAYVAYYHRSRTHLSLDKDAPVPRQSAAPSEGPVVSIRKSVVFTTDTNAERRRTHLRPRASSPANNRTTWALAAARSPNKVLIRLREISEPRGLTAAAAAAPTPCGGSSFW
jgi:Integrase core domain